LTWKLVTLGRSFNHRGQARSTSNMHHPICLVLTGELFGPLLRGSMPSITKRPSIVTMARAQGGSGR